MNNWKIKSYIAWLTLNIYSSHMLLQTGKDLLGDPTSNICSCLHTCGNVSEVSLRKMCCMPQHISDVYFCVVTPNVFCQNTVHESCVQDLPSYVLLPLWPTLSIYSQAGVFEAWREPHLTPLFHAVPTWVKVILSLRENLSSWQLHTQPHRFVSLQWNTIHSEEHLTVFVL